MYQNTNNNNILFNMKHIENDIKDLYKKTSTAIDKKITAHFNTPSMYNKNQTNILTNDTDSVKNTVKNITDFIQKYKILIILYIIIFVFLIIYKPNFICTRNISDKRKKINLRKLIILMVFLLMIGIILYKKGYLSNINT